MIGCHGRRSVLHLVVSTDALSGQPEPALASVQAQTTSPT